MISVNDPVGEAFHIKYYGGSNPHGSVLHRTSWMGVGLLKCPLDLWIYQEIMFEMKPDLIIETGTHNGGSALFFSHLFDILGKGEIITIDVNRPANPPQHPRITYITSSSTDPNTVNRVRERAAGKSSVMVVLDSDHTAPHVLNEMHAYHSLVTPRNYMIVEDTNINGHPALPGWGPGPFEAIQAFMKQNQDFEIDYGCEKLHLTMNPCGYLRKKG